MEEKKICSCCGKENDISCEFCVECGSVLTGVTVEQSEQNAKPQEEYIPEQENTVPPETSANGTYGYNYNTAESETVTSAEMNRFIGKKADKISPKFTTMEITGSKVSWNWPVFFLTFFMGLSGTALWFFYRKMNKIGAILLSVGMALSLVFSVASGQLQLNAETNSMIIDALTDSESVEDAFGAIQNLPDNVIEETARGAVADAVANTVDIACAVVFGMFSLYLYKNHCLKTITKIKKNAMSEVASIAMYDQLGGVSSGAVWVAILINIFASSALEEILTVLLYGI